MNPVKILSIQSTLLTRLKKAYYNRKPVVNPRKKESDYETDPTEMGHDNKLKAEMKAKKANLKNIYALLNSPEIPIYQDLRDVVGVFGFTTNQEIQDGRQRESRMLFNAMNVGLQEVYIYLELS